MYAGAISAAILEHAGLETMSVLIQRNYLSHGSFNHTSVIAAQQHRRALASHVRQSPVCDDQLMPRMFVEQPSKCFVRR